MATWTTSFNTRGFRTGDARQKCPHAKRNPVYRFSVTRFFLAAGSLAAILSGSGIIASAGPLFFVTIENDLFVGRDEQYTSGTRFAWLSNELSADELPAWIRRGALPASGERDAVYNYGFSVGQMIFTPSETRKRPPSSADRPYAGYLFADAWLNSRTDNRIEIFIAQIGMVGPEAGGRFVQETAHRFIGGQKPNGWEHQLKTEPIVQLGYERRGRFPVFRTGAEDRFEVSPHAGFGFGNLAAYANAGATLRFRTAPGSASWGSSLPRPGSARTNSHPVGDFDAGARHVLVGFDGRAIARNLFLDGNTFRESPSVDRKTFVGDLFAGFELTFNRTSLTYLVVWRSREFETQRRPHLFGSLSLAVQY